MEDAVNILIVDDSASKLLAISAALTELQQNVVLAQSGREALRHLLNQEFAVILLDVNMPEMDGLETARLIRQRESLAHVPIIFITAYEDDAHATHGYSLGAVDYLLTPVVPEVLRTKVGVFVELFKKNREVHQQAEERIALAHEQAARRAAETANQIKDEFLATLSHELRTPLNAIVGWTHLLRMDPTTPSSVMEGLDVIERNARLQARIIEDLLDVSRIMSGKLQLDLQPASLAEILQAAVTAQQPVAESQQVTLTLELPFDVPPILADAGRVQQVVSNLITNAIKFTPRDGRVQVRSRVVESHVEIGVTDTGQGISPEFLPYVFDRFRQADASTTRRQGGLGLGLAIVRQLVLMHGGSVDVTSPGLGQGATFTVCLPVAVPSEIEVLPAPLGNLGGESLDSSRSIDLRRLRVLSVDDEPDAREMVRRILTESGALVTIAGSATAALEVLEAEPIDLIVTDIGMPVVDGYELIRRIRARWPAEELPAVALTAYARKEDRQKMLAAGFQLHMAKPIHPPDLVAGIASLVRIAPEALPDEPRSGAAAHVGPISAGRD